VITDRVASRRKYTDKYFFARMKALAGTIPKYIDDAKNGSQDAVYRQPEWRQYELRPSTCWPPDSILEK
jgi:hypothetical protein